MNDIQATTTDRAGMMQEDLRDLSYQQLFYFSPWSSQHAAMTFDHHMPNIHPEALKTAIGQLVSRHEILRTSFVRVNDGIKQKVIPMNRFNLEFHIHEPAVSDSEMTMIINREKRRIFDIDARDLFNVKLFRLETGGHTVLFTMHHGLSDSYSAGVFKQELIELYLAIVLKRTPRLTRPPFQYSDFTRWQKHFVNSREGLLHQQYWLARLKGFNPELKFRSSTVTGNGKEGRDVNICITSVIEGPLGEELDRFRKSNGLTRAIILMGVFTIMINRLNNQDDITLFVPFSARESKHYGELDCKQLIGCFVNALLIRNRIDKDRPVTGFLKESQDHFMNDLSFASYPFCKLLHELPEPHPEASFLETAAYFNYHNYGYLREMTYGADETEKQGQKMVSLPGGGGSLGLDIMEFKNCLRLTMRLKRDIFNDEQAAEINNRYFTILKRVFHDQTISVAAAGEPVE